MAREVSFGPVGSGDSLRWVPSDDILGGRRHDLVCLYPVLISIAAHIGV